MLEIITCLHQLDLAYRMCIFSLKLHEILYFWLNVSSSKTLPFISKIIINCAYGITKHLFHGTGWYCIVMLLFNFRFWLHRSNMLEVLKHHFLSTFYICIYKRLVSFAYKSYGHYWIQSNKHMGFYLVIQLLYNSMGLRGL